MKHENKIIDLNRALSPTIPYIFPDTGKTESRELRHMVEPHHILLTAEEH